MNKRVSRRLGAQLFCGVLLALLAALAVFFPCCALGTRLLERTVYGRPFEERMAEKQFSKLQEYVAQEKIGQENLHHLNAWCSRGDKVYLILYLDGRLLYEYPAASGMEPDPEDFPLAYEAPDREYSLILGDGTAVRAFLQYYAGDAFYYWALLLSGLLAFGVFSFCFIAFVHRKLRVIKRLKAELDILAGGDLRHPVTITGEDELGELASGIDQMRRSILAHQAAEEEIRSANSQLVTAMSHDLRTPLTSLLAYLELMDRGKYNDEEQLRHFIGQSLNKTLQIKAMADKLFEYFLVYSSEWEEPETERMDADGLIQQFWGEYAFSLESKDFSVDCRFEELKGCVQVSIDLLRRAFDNLYSNLLKYADPVWPVEISCRREGKSLRLEITNLIPSQQTRKESSNIGLATCRRIIRYHDGSFSAGQDGRVFRVEILLPLSG